MKKITLTLALCCLAAFLTSCGGNYRKIQTAQEQSSPYTCEGLHMRNAQWHFTDDFGQNVDVVGSCAKGMKHGTFEFYIDRQLVAKTKYIRDAEHKTTCLAQGKTRLDLNTCMTIKAENRTQASEANDNAIQNVIETPDNTEGEESAEE